MNEIFLQKTISDLGYSNIISFATQQAKLILLSKIEEYRNLIQKLNRKYKMTYPEFEKKYLNTPDKENFEKENDGMDWRFYYESYIMYSKDLKKC